MSNSFGKNFILTKITKLNSFEIFFFFGILTIIAVRSIPAGMTTLFADSRCFFAVFEIKTIPTVILTSGSIFVLFTFWNIELLPVKKMKYYDGQLNDRQRSVMSRTLWHLLWDSLPCLHIGPSHPASHLLPGHFPETGSQASPFKQ